MAEIRQTILSTSSSICSSIILFLLSCFPLRVELSFSYFANIFELTSIMITKIVNGQNRWEVYIDVACRKTDFNKLTQNTRL